VLLRDKIRSTDHQPGVLGNLQANASAPAADDLMDDDLGQFNYAWTTWILQDGVWALNRRI
jgi:hypothetical protein